MGKCMKCRNKNGRSRQGARGEWMLCRNSSVVATKMVINQANISVVKTWNYLAGNASQLRDLVKARPLPFQVVDATSIDRQLQIFNAVCFVRFGRFFSLVAGRVFVFALFWLNRQIATNGWSTKGNDRRNESVCPAKQHSIQFGNGQLCAAILIGHSMWSSSSFETSSW